MSAFTVPLKTAPPSQISDLDIPDSDFDYGLDEALLLEETSQNQTSQPSLVSTTLPPPSDPTINPHLAAAAITAEVESAKKHINNPSLDPQNTSHYILGTLIVRVISGRNIPAAYAGGLSQVFTGGSTSTQKKNAQPRSQRVLRMLSSGTSNPYCKVTFDSTSQNLQQVFDTLDPNFTRESLFFDVKLPTKDLALVESFEPPSSILTVDLLHTDQENVKGKKGIKKSQDIEITPLGSIRLNILDIITGRASSVDDWFDLPSQGQLRIMVEYEVTDPAPQIRDLVLLNGFCTPSDLYPIPVDRMFEVDDVEGDRVVLRCFSEEEWECVFEVHRFCVIGGRRHQKAIEQYQDKVSRSIYLRRIV
ncbi:hypothetical protein TL16_g03730 [Triparma laevis f. inornata]|uniref:C2 domain-containing protein n=1 Tax=Triparma laevis f. inornata TaxID=1714386 RepID=A0A9W7A042_9STRA|nr:hypothetical protein TL16_g03730 [Triparma laevis f. inornata]